ncbi:MAG: RidA family protein [Candidatus Nanopelagicales bacterium]
MAELGIELPPAPKALAAYVPAVVTADWVYTAGQLPLRGGEPIATGLVGGDVSAEIAADCARQCALNALAAIKGAVEDLDRVERIVKVTGFVASAPGFSGQPLVLNGASELLATAMGDRGVHARSAVGVAVLPLNVPVEVEVIARLRG